MSTKDDLLSRVTDYIEKSEEDEKNYRQLAYDVNEFLKTQFDRCPTDDLNKLLFKLAELPSNSFRQGIILGNLKCLLKYL